MRFNNYLQESYVLLASSMYGKSYPIFLNPSPKEMREAVDADGYVRYLVVMKEKKLYIWNYNLTHVDAAPNLAHEKLIPEDAYYPGRKGYIWGVAQIKGRSLVDYPETEYNMNFIKYHGIEKAKDDWTFKYFKTSLYNDMRAAVGIPLKEEYITTLRSGNEPYSIYQNPNEDDFKELAKEIRKGGDSELNVRVIVDLHNKNLYIWDANRAIHNTVMHQLVRETTMSTDTLEIQSVLRNNRIFISKIVRMYCKEYSWLKGYFT